MIEIGQATQEAVEDVVVLLVEQLASHAIDLAVEAVRAAVAGMLEDPTRGFILVARDGEEMVGVAYVSFLWAVEHGGRACWLEELYVVPERRGGGVGGRLLDAAIERARSLGCAAMDLEVDVGHARAEHLYARGGFHRLPRGRWVRELI